MPPTARRLLLVAAVAAVAIAAGVWWNAPERRLYRRLDAFLAQLEKSGEEGQLASAATARGVLDYFAPGFLVRAAPYEGSLAGPQELMGAVLRFRATARSIGLRDSDREAHLQGPPRSALVTFVVTVTMDQGRGPATERWRVRSLWSEADGEWRISELELVERLEGGVLPF